MRTSAVWEAVVSCAAVRARASNHVGSTATLTSELLTVETHRAVRTTGTAQRSIVVVRSQRIDGITTEPSHRRATDINIIRILLHLGYYYTHCYNYYYTGTAQGSIVVVCSQRIDGLTTEPSHRRATDINIIRICLLYTSPSPRD